MSASFYSQVTRFYQLLDLDQDGTIDREEVRLLHTRDGTAREDRRVYKLVANAPPVWGRKSMLSSVHSACAWVADCESFSTRSPLNLLPLRTQARLGFTACFSDVHRDTEALGGNKEAIINQQVSWLFSAAVDPEADPATASGIDEAAFKACYQKLLAAAYEEEVLSLDLKRAIDSLSSSRAWQEMRDIFKQTRDIFAALGTQTLSTSDERHRAALDTIFQPITGRSGVLGPRSQTAARKIVTPVLAADAQSSVEQVIKTIKEVLAVPVPAEIIKKSTEEYEHTLARRTCACVERPADQLSTSALTDVRSSVCALLVQRSSTRHGLGFGISIGHADGGLKTIMIAPPTRRCCIANRLLPSCLHLSRARPSLPSLLRARSDRTPPR